MISEFDLIARFFSHPAHSAILGVGDDAALVGHSEGHETVVSIDTPPPPPDWAVQERELLRANAAACRVFFDRYFDERGYLQCVERWGGDDGPDDAIEHYTKGIETIHYIKSWQMSYAQGNIVKYVSRYNLKHQHKEHQIQDLKKALWYLEDMIKDLEATPTVPNPY